MEKKFTKVVEFTITRAQARRNHSLVTIKKCSNKVPITLLDSFIFLSLLKHFVVKRKGKIK